MQTLKPKMFVKANQKTEKYECAICNYITEKPYLCRGKCQKIFCFQCINCIKKNTNQCPFRCSKPFDLTECKQVQLQFNCPFAKNECQHPISSLFQFYEHAYICKYTPENWKFKEQNYKKYRCDKGHDLFFLDEQGLRKLYGWNFYQSPTNSTCSGCSIKGLSRSICPKCSQKDKHVLYCTNCRKPPCTKKTCLYQHSFKKQINSSKGLICDFCGTAAFLLGPYAFRDLRCNFDICEVCYINLPDTHELVPFKMPKSAINHLCAQNQANYQDHPTRLRQLMRALQMQQNMQPFSQHFQHMINVNHQALNMDIQHEQQVYSVSSQEQVENHQQEEEQEHIPQEQAYNNEQQFMNQMSDQEDQRVSQQSNYDVQQHYDVGQQYSQHQNQEYFYQDF